MKENYKRLHSSLNSLLQNFEQTNSNFIGDIMEALDDETIDGNLFPIGPNKRDPYRIHYLHRELIDTAEKLVVLLEVSNNPSGQKYLTSKRSRLSHNTNP